ncbi:hypothetical protein CN444_15910 [Bacillus thuringiensis]|nr:hypothetical protein CN444_15910 [Bacillus thuringiensis]
MQYKDFATKEEELKVMRFYQNDLNSAKLLINVTHDKVVTDFSTATKVQIAFLKPDGKRVFQDVQNVNQMQGKYYVVLSTQTLIAYGNVVAQLRLTFPNNKVIETCKFVFAVDESIMSDTALESTNEFPVIQKAIEVGEKFKDVDFAPIIKAGELAAGALPKAGGTMTGNLLMTNTAGAISTRYQAGATPVSLGWEALTDGQFRLYDWKNSRNVLSYDPTSDTVNINRNTNVVKKAEIYSDLVQASGNTKVLAAATDLNTVQATGCYAGSAFVNAPEGLTSYMYIEVLRYSDVKYVKQVATILTGGSVPRVFVRRMNNNAWESWVESINSSGGTIAGNLNLDRKASETRDMVYRKDGVDQLFLGVNNSDKFRLWDNVNTLTAFEYAPLTKLFTIFQDLALPKGATVTGPLTLSGISSQLRIDDKGPSIRIDQPTDTATTSARGVTLHENNVLMGGFGRIRNGTFLDQMYMGWGANPWSESTSLTVSDTKFTYKNKPVAMRDKDGRVNLTLTADASHVDSANIGAIIDRRGNTVTLRMAIRRTSATSTVLTTISADMRPLLSIHQGITATDGTVARLNIATNGNVFIENGLTSAQNKDFYITITYVVD